VLASRLAVNHGGRWAGFAADTLAVEHDQLVAQTLPQTFVAKADEPAIGRLMRPKMLGQLPPGTTAAQDIENRVQHFTHWSNTTAACLGRGRHERRNDLPFLVAQIAAITQMVRFILRTGLGHPHRSLQKEGDSSLDSIDLPKCEIQL
jgi:hypothetical protein